MRGAPGAGNSRAYPAVVRGMDKSDVKIMGECGCDGDRAGLIAVLGDHYEVVHQDTSDYEYEHTFDAIFKLPDGRFIHAECGGCSCGGSGSWSIEPNEEFARRRVPEWKRP